MFVLASHLWLRDNSVSVTQLNCLQGQTLWQFYGVKLCFFKNSSQTKKENVQRLSTRLCSHLETIHFSSGYEKNNVFASNLKVTRTEMVSVGSSHYEETDCTLKAHFNAVKSEAFIPYAHYFPAYTNWSFKQKYTLKIPSVCSYLAQKRLEKSLNTEVLCCGV